MDPVRCDCVGCEIKTLMYPYLDCNYTVCYILNPVQIKNRLCLPTVSCSVILNAERSAIAGLLPIIQNQTSLEVNQYQRFLSRPLLQQVLVPSMLTHYHQQQSFSCNIHIALVLVL